MSSRRNRAGRTRVPGPELLSSFSVRRKSRDSGAGLKAVGVGRVSLRNNAIIHCGRILQVIYEIGFPSPSYKTVLLKNRKES